MWDVATAAWWMCATDVVWVLAETRNPRIYWATVKRRNPELFANCKQLRIPARDGKRYLTDVIDDHALDALLAVIRSPRKEIFQKWLSSLGNSLDERSKEKAYDTYHIGKKTCFIFCRKRSAIGENVGYFFQTRYSFVVSLGKSGRKHSPLLFDVSTRRSKDSK